MNFITSFLEAPPNKHYLIIKKTVCARHAKVSVNVHEQQSS